MKFYILLIFLLIQSILFSQISVDNTQSAQDLVQLLFNNSGCANISNFTVNGNNSYASFDRNGTNFPFDNGIVLSTGFINNVPGPNATLSDDNLGTANDADMLNHFSNTFDTTILEFDFIPVTSYISFEYLFASEEYQENNGNTCVYSDVFAFLIKASTDTNYTNIALVPNTSTPVQVTTVHPAINGSCQAENEAYFGQWNSQTDPINPINFNGQTTVLKAESIVIPNTTYHIKLIIADHSNYRYDSAVFLKAGSFNVGTDLGIDKLVSTHNALCGNETITLDSGYASASSYQWFIDTFPYDDVYTQITGANSQTYTVTSGGKYKVKVDLGSGCISEGKIIIEYDHSVGIDLGVDLLRNTNNALCGNDTFTLDCGYSSAVSYKWFIDDVPYNNIYTQISSANSQIYTVTSEGKYKVEIELESGCLFEDEIIIEYVGNNGINLGVDLLRSTQNTLCGSETIMLDCGYSSALSCKWFIDALPYDGVFTQISGANSQTYTVTSEGKYKVKVDLGSGCISEGKIIIEYDSLPITFDTNLIGCNDDLSDFYIFNLSDTNSQITNNDTSLIIQGYYHSYADAQLLNNPITNFGNYTNQSLNEEIFARIENQSGCSSIAKITLQVYHNPRILDDETQYYCLNTTPNTLTLFAGLKNGNPQNYTFNWLYNDNINPIIDLNKQTETIEVISEGVYTVEITNTDGCMVSRNITVINSNIATITDVIVSETLFPDRISIKIEAIGEGDYEYAIDDYQFQDSPIFDYLLYGYHIITVKDKNGCLPNTQKEITILQYQKFFSPNNDTHYDYWTLNNINSLLLHYNTISDITIFDRYGKVMAIINPKSNGWNGYYNGALSLPNDYWFSVDLVDFNGKVTSKRGNFSLVR